MLSQAACIDSFDGLAGLSAEDGEGPVTAAEHVGPVSAQEQRPAQEIASSTVLNITPYKFLPWHYC